MAVCVSELGGLAVVLGLSRALSLRWLAIEGRSPVQKLVCSLRTHAAFADVIQDGACGMGDYERFSGMPWYQRCSISQLCCRSSTLQTIHRI